MSVTRRSQHGFTLLELLLVLAVFGILAGIGFVALGGLRRSLTIEGTANQVAQDFGRARARALASGNDWRFRLVTTNTYVVEEHVGANWIQRIGTTLAGGATVSSPAPGTLATFDSRGFAQFSPTNLVLTVVDGSSTKDVVPAMTGTARIR